MKSPKRPYAWFCNYKIWMILIALMFSALGYSLATTTSSENASERCLYAAVSAYPNWAGPGMLLDNLDACEGLTEPQKNHLREMIKDFYESSLNR